MTWSELRRIAIDNGWTFYRHGGNHDVYKKNGKRKNLVIERHWNQEVRPGMMYKLFKIIYDEGTRDN